MVIKISLKFQSKIIVLFSRYLDFSETTIAKKNHILYSYVISSKLLEKFHHMIQVSIQYKSVHDPVLTDIYNFFENDKKTFLTPNPWRGLQEFKKKQFCRTSLQGLWSKMFFCHFQ